MQLADGEPRCVHARVWVPTSARAPARSACARACSACARARSACAYECTMQSPTRIGVRAT
eukprot:6202727-Pleurochrysis_carterae.AAC.1